jgi:CHAT domain-containing protein/tetratricopeptide (TPR) repeat protein
MACVAVKFLPHLTSFFLEMLTSLHISSRRSCARKKLIGVFLLFAFACGALQGQKLASAGSPTKEEELITKRKEALRLVMKGESEQAVRIATELVEEARAEFGSQSFEYAIAWETLGLVQQKAGAYSKAESALRESLGVQRGSGYTGMKFEVTTLGLLSSAVEKSGRLEDAAKVLEEAIALLADEKGLQHAQLLNNLASLKRSLGKRAEARVLSRKACDALGADAPGEEKAMMLSNLALLYSEDENYEEADALFRQAENAIQSATDLHAAARARAAIEKARGYFYQAQRRFPEAAREYQKVLEFHRTEDGEANAATWFSRFDLASLGRETAHYLDAEFQLNEIEKNFPSSPPAEWQTRILNLRGLLGYDQGHKQEAEQAWKAAIAAIESVLPEEQDREQLATLWNNLAGVINDEGRLDQARELYEKALAWRRQAWGSNHERVAEVLGNLAINLAQAGDYQQAATRFKEAHDIYENLITNILGYSDEITKLGYLKNMEGQRFAALSLALSHGTEAPFLKDIAADYALRTKSLTVETLREQRRLGDSGDAQGASEIWKKLQTDQVRIATLLLAGPEHGEQERWTNELDSLGIDREKLEEKFSQLTQSAARDRLALKITAADILKALPRGRAVVDFNRIDLMDFAPGGGWLPSHYVAIVYRGALPHPVIIDLGPADALEALALKYRSLVKGDLGGVRGLVLADEADGSPRALYRKAVTDATTDLSRMVYEPIAAELMDCDVVFLCAEGALSAVPFGALMDRAGDYLINRFEICSLSSPRDVLLRSSENPSQIKDAILVGGIDFGSNESLEHKRSELSGTASEQQDALRDALKGQVFNSLPATSDEINGIAKSLPSPVQILTGQSASKSRILRLSSPRILHFATHGFFLTSPDRGGGWLEQQPLARCGLAMANANLWLSRARSGVQDDGLLLGLEIAGLDLSGCELTVLSACKSGLGLQAGGEGVLGLPRAFQIAGSSAVMFSVWDVPDQETAELIEMFYTEWARGVTRSEALRAAQRKMIANLKERTDGWASPYYWAGFILLETSPIIAGRH